MVTTIPGEAPQRKLINLTFEGRFLESEYREFDRENNSPSMFLLPPQTTMLMFLNQKVTNHIVLLHYNAKINKRGQSEIIAHYYSGITTAN
jgi:hypothetical protein